MKALYGPLITMRLSSLLALPLITMSAFALPVQAGYSQGGGVKDKTCYKEVYREEYTPGTQERPGRVRRWTETKRVPCKGNRRNAPRPYTPERNIDDNSCIEGSILGGIGGGALGGVLSTRENWIWSIPTGVIGGALAGCQLDGG